MQLLDEAGRWKLLFQALPGSGRWRGFCIPNKAGHLIPQPHLGANPRLHEENAIVGLMII